ncbi:MAG: ankyrin repeat domain-containing protein [Sphingomonas sp.]
MREAVGLLDDGDIEGLRALLAANPDLTGRRANFEGENYFRTPTLLAFAAENPVRNDSLPPNIVAIAELLISGTAASDVQETVGLVASGRVAREAGVQDDLIALLCRHGADPDRAVSAALVHGEFGAVAALRQCGAGMTLPMAAALGEVDQARALLTANSAERHLATAFAAQHGHAEILALLLDSGEDPDRYNPVSAHSHSTPLHQAVGHGHAAAVQTLLARGARTDLRDTLWNGTPLDWANHAGRADMVALLGD